MKKYVKIILVIVAVLVIVVGYIGYKIYQMTQGSEDITGVREEIPVEKSLLEEITYGDFDWPNWSGPDLNGKSKLTGIKTDWSKGLKKLWQVDFLCQGNSTATWSTPVVQGNRLVVPGRDEKNDLVFCLNTNDGSLIWVGSYESEAGTSHGPGARATPFIDKERVYTFGRAGDLVCWNLFDGKQLWRKSVMDIGGSEPDWGLSTSPFVYENKVLVQGGGQALAVAYNKKNGDVIWKSMEGDAGYSAATKINIDGETKFLVYHAKGLSCLNSDNGKVNWTVPWETSYGVNATTPIVIGNIVFHSSGYGMGGQAIEVNNDGYKVLWKNDDFLAQHTDPVIIDGYIYGYSGESSRNKGYFTCLEMATGKEMWSTNKIGWGTMAYVDGYLICLDIKGNLFLVDPGPEEFKKIGEIKNVLKDVKHFSWTRPVVANGKLFIRYLQTLICFDLMP